MIHLFILGYGTIKIMKYNIYMQLLEIFFKCARENHENKIKSLKQKLVIVAALQILIVFIYITVISTKKYFRQFANILKMEVFLQYISCFTKNINKFQTKLKVLKEV